MFLTERGCSFTTTAERDCGLNSVAEHHCGKFRQGVDLRASGRQHHRCRRRTFFFFFRLLTDVRDCVSFQKNQVRGRHARCKFIVDTGLRGSMATFFEETLERSFVAILPQVATLLKVTFKRCLGGHQHAFWSPLRKIPSCPCRRVFRNSPHRLLLSLHHIQFFHT